MRKFLIISILFLSSCSSQKEYMAWLKASSESAARGAPIIAEIDLPDQGRIVIRDPGGIVRFQPPQDSMWWQPLAQIGLMGGIQWALAHEARKGNEGLYDVLGAAMQSPGTNYTIDTGGGNSAINTGTNVGHDYVSGTWTQQIDNSTAPTEVVEVQQPMVLSPEVYQIQPYVINQPYVVHPDIVEVPICPDCL